MGIPMAQVAISYAVLEMVMCHLSATYAASSLAMEEAQINDLFET